MGEVSNQFLYESSMKRKPLLTIAIPTFNRANFLDLCLMRISEELSSLTEEEATLVNIFVSNNASTDDTTEVISKFELLLQHKINITLNKENIGADCNIAQCYELARTPYVWILGDDDVLLPGSLTMVLEVLINQNPDILYLNHYWFKSHYEDRVRQNKSLSFFKSSNSLDFARKTNVMLTFISGLVVRSGVGLEFRKSLLASNLVQFSWILPLLRDGNCFVVIENELLAARGQNSGGYELVNVFANNLKKITNEILHENLKVAQVIQNGTIVKFFPSAIMMIRKGNSQFKDKEMASNIQNALGDNWRYHVFLAPLLNMPIFLSRCYYYFVRLIAKVFGSCFI